MTMNRRVAVFLAFALMSMIGIPRTSGGSTEVVGVVAVVTVSGEGRLVAMLDVPVGSSVRGLRWYNNDSQNAFSGVQLAEGVDPATLKVLASCAATEGASSSWIDQALPEPISRGEQPLWVVFTCDGVEYPSGRGPGTGTAVGYLGADEASGQAWIGSASGGWVQVSPSIQIAVEPVLAQSGLGKVAGGTQRPSSKEFRGLRIDRVFPNPTNPNVAIQFSLGTRSAVSVDIYDARGRRVDSRDLGVAEAGSHEFVWLGMTALGREVASGVYFAVVRSNAGTQRTKITLVR